MKLLCRILPHKLAKTGFTEGSFGLPLRKCTRCGIGYVYLPFFGGMWLDPKTLDETIRRLEEDRELRKHDNVVLLKDHQ